MKMKAEGLHFSGVGEYFTVSNKRISIPVNIRFNHIAAAKPLSLRGLQPIFDC